MPNLKILVVNGRPTAGKDAFIDFCIEELREKGLSALKISSVDAVKNAARMLGWDDVKDARGRMFLSDLKDLSTAAYDGPMKCMRFSIQVARETQAAAIFLLIREPEEIARLVGEYPEAKTVLVERSGEQSEASNHADERVNEFTYDLRIQNDKDLQNLRYRARKFLKEVGLTSTGGAA